jgi:hypothetical protein
MLYFSNGYKNRTAAATEPLSVNEHTAAGYPAAPTAKVLKTTQP